jgi:sugar lactone lactonase YvrE
MSPRTTIVLLDDLVFPEGPRWHDDRLWFSDQHDKRVVATDLDGKAETIVEVPQQPSGLGWLPDNRMLVVSMLDRKVLRLEGGELTEHANLEHLAPWSCNDMVVDRTGRAYVGNFGFDMYGGETPATTNLIAIEPDGSNARTVATDLGFPNGTVITEDGNTLLVGESMAARITAFDVAPDGSLTNRREWAQLHGATVDGMCLDAEGAIWAACPFTGKVRRIREGGDVVDEVEGTHPGAFACMLGGPHRTTLFVCTAPTHVPDEARVAHAGRIEIVDVDVPGMGLP